MPEYKESFHRKLVGVKCSLGRSLRNFFAQILLLIEQKQQLVDIRLSDAHCRAKNLGGMEQLNAALLVNLLGFSVGIALYFLLAVMVVRHRESRRSENADLLLMMTAGLGLLWNLGELFAFAQKDFGGVAIPPMITALSFSALGFLPSVVVHSASSDEPRTLWLTLAAYGLSIGATILHFRAVILGIPVPSDPALQTLTFGSLALAAGLLIFNFRQTLEKKAVFATALLVFAVSALHLSGEREGVNWYIELIAHQSSIPLALVILYQNYRFAFADLFLKRAISLTMLAGVALGLYVGIAVPVLRYHETHDRNDVQAAALMIGLWVATALAYPAIYRFAVWLVDRVILSRPDYSRLLRSITEEIEKADSVDGVLAALLDRLSESLTADRASTKETVFPGERSALATIESNRRMARLTIPTSDSPQFQVELSGFSGGRRLLSDEISLLESAALMAARRIDALRVSHERFEQKFREQEFAKLATEAQLTALRSQINPHFLFNALTTLGYLIKTSPDKAYDTLLRLTQLLRGVLKNTGEFTTLAAEIDLIESYLDIERARFEEKLSVKIDVVDSLRSQRVPSLILQPLVENAIKHGISENKKGGTVRITADVSDGCLRLTVWDSGAGRTVIHDENPSGVGLRNIHERLRSYYGDAASLDVSIGGTDGTTARLLIPVTGRKNAVSNSDNAAERMVAR
jgi:hypothetical protein